MSVQNVPPPPPPPPPPAPAPEGAAVRKKSPLGLILLIVGLLVVLGGVGTFLFIKLRKPVEDPDAQTSTSSTQKPKPQKPKDTHKSKVSEALPILSSDPVKGDAGAPITIVEFGDYGHGDTRAAHKTLNELREKYGAKLRFVWKESAGKASTTSYGSSVARVTRVVALAASDVAFWKIHDRAMEEGTSSSSEVTGWAADYDVTYDVVSRYGEAADKQIEANVELAKKLGVTVTPTFFVNGERIVGNQPRKNFEEIIDAQLEAAKKLTDGGTDSRDVYATLTDRNYMDPAPSVMGTLYDVDLSGGASWGANDALVTVVVFAVVAPNISRDWTLGDLVGLEDTRVVFHDLIEIADDRIPAMVVRAIGAKAGEVARRSAIDEIRTTKDEVDVAWLTKLGAKHGLSAAEVSKAVAAAPKAPELDDEILRANDVDAKAMSTVYVNGRILTGQSKKDILAAHAYELKRTKKMLERGTAKADVYKESVAKGKRKRPKSVVVPVPADAPSRGPEKAPVTIQVFADFECFYCKKAMTGDFAKAVTAHSTEVRVVFRNFLLSMHTNAEPAAQLALEAKAQKGMASFWRVHDALYALVGKPDRAALDTIAKAEGLDMAKVKDAIETHKYKKFLDEEQKAGTAAEVTGTPHFIVGDEVVTGAQPQATFEAAILRQKSKAPKP